MKRHFSPETIAKRVATRIASSDERLVPRFFARVKKTRSCWNWIGTINSTHPNKGGYGTLRFNGKRHRVHRLSWMIHNGKISPEVLVLHKCDNRICVNPKHLFIGTQLDNMRDRFKKGRKYVTAKV